jgi:hypothetical protein
MKEPLPNFLVSSSLSTYEGCLFPRCLCALPLARFCPFFGLESVSDLSVLLTSVLSTSGRFSAKRKPFPMKFGGVLVATQPNGYSVVNFGVSPCHPFGLRPV